MVVAEAQVGVAPSFRVAGIGGVIVTRSVRGRGHGRMLIERVLELAGELGVSRAMLFCLPDRLPLYAKFGFLRIDAPVWAQQPQGRIEVPLYAMWKPLGAAAGWPSGAVELLGEPF